VAVVTSGIGVACERFLRIHPRRAELARPPQTPAGDDGTILASSLALGSADYSWRAQAICRDTDPELFFPVGTTGQALLQLSKAKETCDQCDVKVQCLQFALDTNQDSGVWGGTSEEERRSIRREIAARNRSRAAG
jgi:WhiB family redox-sensing transcriptional regulator